MRTAISTPPCHPSTLLPLPPLRIGRRDHRIIIAVSLPELQRGQATVNAVFDSLKFIVRAGFHHAPARDDDNSVGMTHRGEAVRDDERSAPMHEGFQGLLNQALAL